MKIFLPIVLALLFTIPAASAPCVNAAFSSYLVAGFSCDVNAAVFSDFAFSLQNDTSPTVALTPADIQVSPLIAAGQVGLRFSGNFQALGAENGPGPAEGIRNITYRFFFDVTRPGSQFLSVGAVLNNPSRLAPNPLKFGDIFASNQAANDAALAIANDDDPDLADTVALNSPRLTVVADDLLVLTAGASAVGTTTPVGFVSASSADYLFGYQVLVPELGTAWMLVAGGMSLMAIRIMKARRHHP